ncbi:rhodanese-like domain-containing protein [Runella sp.]|uniref:rhodanese-like domain-containing protein n=1 Tax=Runella sp. TaxID=1960881 RepID=UPI003D11879E
MKNENKLNTYQDISLSEAETMAKQPGSIVVDVREPWEFEEFNIGGINIPLGDIRERRPELLPYQTLIVVCTNGTRSRVAAKDYCRAEEFQTKNIFHLKGGILEVED